MNKPEKVSRRKAVNLTADAKLVEAAKSMGMNLSQVFEDGLRKVVLEEVQRRWEEENREAIDEHNARVEREGILGMKVRGR